MRSRTRYIMIAVLCVALSSCGMHPIPSAAAEERSYGESKVETEYVETGDDWTGIAICAIGFSLATAGGIYLVKSKTRK